MGDQHPVPCDAGEAALIWVGSMMKSLNISHVFDPESPAVTARLQTYLNSQRKEVLANVVTQAWGHIVKQNELIRSLKLSKEKLSDKVIEAQEQTVKVQSELVEWQDNQVQKIGDVVHDSVSGSLREIKSYSEAVSTQATEPTISQATLQKVVKTVVQEEDRAKNVMVFGLEESDSVELHGRVLELFAELGQKPQFEECRIGKSKPGTARPVKVKFRSGAAVADILRKSSGLRTTVKFQRVFVCPDRSKEEQGEQRKLVAELKKKIAEQPGKSHFIRDGKIESKEKETYVDCD